MLSIVTVWVMLTRGKSGRVPALLHALVERLETPSSSGPAREGSAGGRGAPAFIQHHTLVCAQPIIEPGGGSVVVGVTVSLSSPSKEASVYFTTDDTCVPGSRSISRTPSPTTGSRIRRYRTVAGE